MDIYVGNLAYSTTDEGLRLLFAEYGTVTSARVCTDRMTGRSRGFGFVEMPNQQEAQAAVEQARKEYERAKENTLQAEVAKEKAYQLNKYDADAELAKIKAQQAQAASAE